MEKKMIYVLNQYSKNTVQHFFHVIHLLECIADHGVEIALIIEKCDDKPEIAHRGITVYVQKEQHKIKRAAEFYRIIRELVKNQGYKKIFIRISAAAAIIACICGHGYGAEVYYWQSGAAFEYYKNRPFPKNLSYMLESYSMYALIKNMVDYFVTGPEYMVKYYATEGHVKRDKIRLLYNDIDTERFTVISDEEKNKLRDELGLNRNTLYILQVHRFSEVRRTALYIPSIMEFAKKNKNVKLLIIGSGPEEDCVKEKVRSEGFTNIELLGSKPNVEIQKYYQASDIFINPSWVEGFPRVVIEAMASGKPIVATDAGGTKDLFTDVQKPFIVDRENVDGFQSRLQEMVNNKELRENCGRDNRERVKRYNSENVAKMYINVLWENQK